MGCSSESWSGPLKEFDNNWLENLFEGAWSFAEQKAKDPALTEKEMWFQQIKEALKIVVTCFLHLNRKKRRRKKKRRKNKNQRRKGAALPILHIDIVKQFGCPDKPPFKYHLKRLNVRQTEERKKTADFLNSFLCDDFLPRKRMPEKKFA